MYYNFNYEFNHFFVKRSLNILSVRTITFVWSIFSNFE